MLTHPPTHRVTAANTYILPYLLTYLPTTPCNKQHLFHQMSHPLGIGPLDSLYTIQASFEIYNLSSSWSLIVGSYTTHPSFSTVPSFLRTVPHTNTHSLTHSLAVCIGIGPILPPPPPSFCFLLSWGIRYPLEMCTWLSCILTIPGTLYYLPTIVPTTHFPSISPPSKKPRRFSSGDSSRRQGGRKEVRFSTSPTLSHLPATNRQPDTPSTSSQNKRKRIIPHVDKQTPHERRVAEEADRCWRGE